MATLTRRVHVLLDDERYDRLESHAAAHGGSVAAAIREAIDLAFPDAAMDRQRATEAFLRSAEEHPMPAIEDWSTYKRQMRDEMYKVDRYGDR